MLKLVSDHNFNRLLIIQLRHLLPELDLVQVRDVGLARASDETILEWAANEDRLLLTHDLRTVPKFAYARIANNQFMPGVIAIPSDASKGQVINDLSILLECSLDGEYENRVIYLPL